jgi:hypothetical protein
MTSPATTSVTGRSDLTVLPIIGEDGCRETEVLTEQLGNRESVEEEAL